VSKLGFGIEVYYSKHYFGIFWYFIPRYSLSIKYLIYVQMDDIYYLHSNDAELTHKS
jgi:hypothetical protein